MKNIESFDSFVNEGIFTRITSKNKELIKKIDSIIDNVDDKESQINLVKEISPLTGLKPSLTDSDIERMIKNDSVHQVLLGILIHLKKGKDVSDIIIYPPIKNRTLWTVTSKNEPTPFSHG